LLSRYITWIGRGENTEYRRRGKTILGPVMYNREIVEGHLLEGSLFGAGEREKKTKKLVKVGAEASE